MSIRTIGFVLIALGVVIAVVSLAADVIGIGNQIGIGWKQLLGTAIGIIVALVGVWLVSRKPIQKK
jgi:uncharacterized membrane protein YgaE (UPF0421/DUF939 family)